jgi:hypothetical protein
MIRRLLVGVAVAALSIGCTPMPEGEIDTYCPECYQRIQDGQAFAPAKPQPDETEGGASR